MAATDSAAADEFAALQRTQTTHLSHHPSDDSDSDSNDIDSDDDAHKPTYRQAKPSLRFGNSRHKKHNNNDEDDENGEDDDDDDWDARYGGSSVFAVKDRGYELPKGEQGRMMGNTGPKGVIADARAAEREKREEKEVARRRGHVRMDERAEGEEEEVGRKWYQDEDESGDDDDDDDDGEFMKEWRRKRMGEVAAAAAVARKSSGSRGKGIVETVDALGYLEAVDGAARGDVVVVYISDSEVCIVLFNTLTPPYPCHSPPTTLRSTSHVKPR